MIKIGSSIDLNKLAEMHWDWLKEKLMYDKDLATLESMDSVEPSINTRKNIALRKMLGDKIWKNLKNIVTGDLEYLLSLKSDSDYIHFFSPIEETKEKIKCKEKISIIFDNWHNKKTMKHSNYKAERSRLKQIISKCEKIEDDFTKATTTHIDKLAVKKNELPYISYNLVDLLRYDEFHSSDNWNANHLCELLNVSVCPYCNRQYIFVAKKNDGKWISSAQIDHFLPKTLYPLFSCSFYNLIPSCYCCNHGKSNDERITIHPFSQDFGENGKFCLEYKDKNLHSSNFNLQKDFEIGFDISCNDQTKKKLINNSIDVFHLKEMYNKHQIDLRDFLERYLIYQEAKQKDYKNIGILDDEMSRLLKDNSQKKNIILGLPIGPGSQNADYPLKKLKKDLFKQLEKAEKFTL